MGILFVFLLWTIGVVVFIIQIAALWKLFSMAGKPGWACLIPIYNIIVYFQVAGKPAWWILLLLIPGVNVVIKIIVDLDFARAFNKSTAFAIGIILLPVIFLPVLAFSQETKYVGVTPR